MTSRCLDPAGGRLRPGGLLSFRDWLAAHADQIPIPPDEG
mgnify:CR=1 FL=1